MRFARPSLPHLLLCAFMLAAGATVARGLRSGPAAALLVPFIAAVFTEIRLARPLVTFATWIARIGAGASVLVGLVQTIYPVVPESVIFGVSSALGHVLMLFASVLLLARSSPGAGALPAILGALIAAFLRPDSSGLSGGAVAAAVALMGWLATSRDDQRSSGTVRLLPLGLFALVSAGLAAGIGALLPWAQPRVEVAMAKMISSDLDAASGLSTESRLGDVERLALSKRIALRLYGDRPVDLRVRTFTRFDGRAWKADPRPAQPLAPKDVPGGRWPGFDQTPGTALAASGAPVAIGLLALRLVVRSPQRGAMPAPAHTIAVKVDGLAVAQNPSGILLPEGPAALYAVLYSEGDEAESPPGPEMLDVPKSLDPRLRELAGSLAGSSLPPAEILDRVTGHFQSGYRYTLDVGPFRTLDPVAEFVFEKKRGYCEYFATASTLLLRLSGVPARYVTGFAVRPFQRSGTHYIVRDSDAHAWTEAYVPGRGWVEVDATPASDYDALHGGALTRGWLASLQATYDELRALLAQAGVSGLGLGLARAAVSHPLSVAIAAVVFLAFGFRKRLRPRPAASPKAATPLALGFCPDLRRLLRGVDDFCAARGAARPPFRAPREHVAAPGLPLDEGERTICLRAVDALYAQAYGDRPVAARELAEVSANVAALRAKRSTTS